MDTSPRIPRPGQNAPAQRGSGSSLPPPGSVVMASVEEDLGEGLYALKWNGNRIAVTSQAVLRPGQSLILKSERSPEGKVTLVVQGPALPDPGEFIGRPVYTSPEKRPPSEANSQPQAGDMAAGVGKPGAASGGAPAASLLGLVLEPMDELQEQVKFVMDEAAVEKEEWQRHFDQSTGKESSQSTIDATNDAVTGEARPETRPAPNEPQPLPVTAQPSAPEQPGETAQPQTQPLSSSQPLVEAKPLLPAEPLPMPATPPPADQPAPAVSPPVVPPEVLLKETLLQILKAVELPLTGSDGYSLALNSGSKVPEAIADKAAAILLRGAGLTPDTATMEAARALVDATVPVDRQIVQVMLALAANVEEGARAALFKAVARQAAKDIPLVAPLATGLADVMLRKEGVNALLGKAVAALRPESLPPEIRPLAASAVEMLELLSVDLEGDDAAMVLERYVSTFGRTALGKATALVETAAQILLEKHPVLPKIDQALTALLTLLEPEMGGEESAPQTLPQPAKPQPAKPQPGEPQPVKPQPGEQPAEQQAQAKPAPQPEQPVPEPIRPSLHNNPYLQVAKPFPGLETLDLPPMPKVVTLPAGHVPAMPIAPPAASLEPPVATVVPPVVTVVPQEQGATLLVQPEQPVPPTLVQPAVPENAQPQPEPGQPAPQPQPQTNTPAPQPNEAMPKPAPGSPTVVTEPEKPVTAEQAKALADAVQEQARNRIFPRLDSYQTPGGNRPEIELLKPSGFLDFFLSAGAGQDSRLGREADRLIRDLLSGDSDKQAQTLRDLPFKEKGVLREAAARLAQMEQQILRADGQMNRLSDASAALRDLGRQLLAVKAENVAGQDRNPQVMLAEVPFKLADNGGDGRMQMFYRRSRKKQGGWTSRVILDLNTTVLGPVLGDMRFFGNDMALNMFVDKQETADFLGKSTDELADHLFEKGFRLKSRFMVLPPPPPPPQLAAERPEMRDESAPAEPIPPILGPGRLDTKA